MTNRTATCTCRALSITTEGDPIKVSACHCGACQKRTGSAFSVAVFFDEAQVTPSGLAGQYVRLGDSGKPVEFSFCPTCGSSVFWRPGFRPGWVGVAIGCFDDKTLKPTQAVYEHEKLDWANIAIEARA